MLQAPILTRILYHRRRPLSRTGTFFASRKYFRQYILSSTPFALFFVMIMLNWFYIKNPKEILTVLPTIIIIALTLPPLAIFGNFFFLRLRFEKKLRSAVKKMGYPLTRGKFLAPLGRKGSRKCEYLIERNEDVLSVKLLGFLSEKYILRFNSPRMVEINDLRFKVKLRAGHLNNFREYLLPPYDFGYLAERPTRKLKKNAEIRRKPIKRCYVICPDVLAFSIANRDGRPPRSNLCKNVGIYSAEEFLSELVKEKEALPQR